FVVVSGPNQESGMSTVNGVVNQYIAISYILQPKRAGNLTLASATAKIDGKNYAASPLKLLVKKNSGGHSSPNPFATVDPFAVPTRQPDFTDFILKPGENVPDKVSKNMQLKLQTSKTSCYVGEPIVASYKLYTRLKSDSKLSKNPSFNGFSVIDLQQPDVTDYAKEKVDGREYNVYTIRKAQLYPLQDGNIELESATLDNNIQFLKEEASNFNGNIDGFVNGFGLNDDALVTQSVSLSSKPVSILVKPLPVAGKPSSFSGAVGQFEIAATLEKNDLKTDESGKLYLVISGRGNLQLVTAPEINWPQQLEAFDAKVTDELVQTDVPVSGRKIFEIPFMVQSAGNYEVPAVSFSFFDPTTASYKTISTAAIALNVVAGASRPGSYAESNTAKEPFSLATEMFKNRIWLVSLLGLLIAMGIFFWIRQDGKQNRKSASVPDGLLFTEKINENLLVAETLAAVSQNPLSLTEACLHSIDCKDFYGLLNQELKKFLAMQFSLPLQDLSAKRVSSLMDKAGIDNTISLQTQALMQDIEWQLYTPYERNDEMDKLYNRAQALVQLIQTYHLQPTR
ncbi:MAG: protein BatD, partial [Gloeobacteraceae cyanobacterium ES-bin-316]|nr:protein BatD [Ferruginibacter sp.]